MKNSTTLTVLVVLVIAAVAAGLIAYPRLPDQVVTHWNAQGVADGYSGRFMGTFLLPFILIVLGGLYLLVPVIDPLRKNIESFRRYYNLFWATIMAFMAYVYGLSLAYNLGASFDVSRALLPGLPVVFWVAGMLIQHSKRSWFVGIRTPWTLSDDTVWERTHALGGKLFKAAAVLSLGALFASDSGILWFILVPALGAVLISVVYSFVVYRQLHR